MEVKHYRLTDTGRTSDLSWQGKGTVPVLAMEVQVSKNKWKHLKSGSNFEYSYGYEQGISNFRYHAHDHNIHAYQIDGIDEHPVMALPLWCEVGFLYDSTGSGNNSPSYYKPIKHGEDFTREDGSTIVFRSRKQAEAFLKEQGDSQPYDYDDYKAW